MSREEILLAAGNAIFAALAESTSKNKQALKKGEFNGLINTIKGAAADHVGFDNCEALGLDMFDLVPLFEAVWDWSLVARSGETNWDRAVVHQGLQFLRSSGSSYQIRILDRTPV